MTKQNNIKHDPINRSIEKPLDTIQHDYLDYNSPSYLSPERMSSYAYQYSLGLSTSCHTFLNIGNANSIIRYLYERQGKYFLEIDIDYNTKPSIVASLPNLPIKSKSIEVAMCFQVLEHLPFNLFLPCIRELHRISKNFIILSLPDISLSRRDTIKMHIFNTIRHPREWKKYKIRTIDKEHFWEIDNLDVSFLDIERIIELEELVIQRHFRNYLNPYHHFLVLVGKDN